MSTTPFRLQILERLTDLLHTVTPANGYQNDLSDDDCVARGRLVIGENEPVPMLALNEPPLAIEQIKAAPQNPNASGDWDILIQGWTEPGELHHTDKAYVLAAEVRKALALEKKKPTGRPGSGHSTDFLGFGSKIEDMRVGAPVVRPPDETSAKACFYLILTLKIVEDMTKPFG